MKFPLVSIITPAYNSEKFIDQAIQSVQQQTFSDWEMILVNDGSSDHTQEIIEKWRLQDPRIKLLTLSKNSGTGVARNKGLEKATGRYIAFLDADDLWTPEKLQKQLDFMVARNIPFTFSFYQQIDEDGNDLQKIVTAPNPLSYTQLLYCNYVGNLTGIYDTDFFGKIDISRFRKRQDWIVWLTIVKRLKIVHPVPEVLAQYRVRQHSISASKIELVKHNYKVYRNFHQMPVLIAFLAMIRFLITQLVLKPRYITRKK
ncbi:glycosyltransferase family 2 protein [Flavobacterium kingsejongi]|uniref:Glycosyl transferase n=1 Tax=Flavobacterium kingsejongi TaxID=1678728 RepID=A0A2S1LLD3_9FLAO|nr:glycosyltransferase family 2 protein [Flavobacterium kingsejongi]AWG24570.1 glycosyl transferase [Flavobacterium kingsejongi]